jgi:allophanate hydrolase
VGGDFANAASIGDSPPSAGPVERVLATYARIEETDRPEVWITLRSRAEAVAEAESVEKRVASGHVLPLAGLTLGVKDNIDVAGIPTTAGCPAFSYTPTRSARVVERLRDAGAVVVGKTNLDQFATGLVGTRSPYGAVRDSRRPEYVSGGSSSGSAVAVALGQVDIALGTDTAGSGRVPAAFQGIVGIKPTRGLVSVVGVVPACRTLDCVTLFTRELALGEVALVIASGLDPDDPLGRARPSDAPLAAPPAPRVGVPRVDTLVGLSNAARSAFAAAAAALEAGGAATIDVDPAPFLEAGVLLYEGAFVAERHAAFGAFVEANSDAVDPSVRAIVTAAAGLSASRLVAEGERRDRLMLAARRTFSELDALLLPTVSHQPTIAQVVADPIGENSRLGVYTNCANLLDLCAVSVPAGEADGGCFGVTVFAPAFADPVAADVARLLTGGVSLARSDGLLLFVAGAHMRGQPLNHELTSRGGRFLGPSSTSSEYRLYRLDTDPPKPGVVRVARGGVSVEGELWCLPPAALGTLLAGVPRPMALGEVRLSDGSRVVGFLCEPVAVTEAEDVTRYAGWRAYLDSLETTTA